MIVQSGLRKTLRVLWIDTGLFAQVKIYDNTAGAMAFLSALPLVEVATGDYLTSFIPADGISYVTRARVYTDGTYTVVDPNYAPSGEDFQAINLSSGSGGGGDIIGVIAPSGGILGVIAPSIGPIIGVVE